MIHFFPDWRCLIGLCVEMEVDRGGSGLFTALWDLDQAEPLPQMDRVCGIFVDLGVESTEKLMKETINQH